MYPQRGSYSWVLSFHPQLLQMSSILEVSSLYLLKGKNLPFAVQGAPWAKAKKLSGSIQLLSRFLANGHLPRMSCLSAIDNDDIEVKPYIFTWWVWLINTVLIYILLLLLFQRKVFVDILSILILYWKFKFMNILYRKVFTWSGLKPWVSQFLCKHATV